MIDNQILEKSAKLSIWLLIVAIIGLILTSILPVLYIQNEAPVNQDLHFNMMLLDETKNDEINNLTKDFNYIVYCYWGIIAFSIISLFGLLINASRKLQKLSNFLIITLFITLISSCLLVILELLVYGKLNSSMIFSYSEIISPFHYFYIPLAFGFFSLYLSAFCCYKIAPSLIEDIKKKETAPKPKKEKVKKEIKPKKKKEKKVKKEEPIKKAKIIPEVKTEAKVDVAEQQEVEDWLSGEIGKIESEPQEIELADEKSKEVSSPFSTEEKKTKDELPKNNENGEIISE